MAAGSLLGVAVNREKYSFPVGKVQMLTMYPMDLEEVLWAKGKQMLTYQDVSAFKLYYSDMGIMSARMGMTLEALRSKETEHFRGILTENYVAIALKTNGYDPVYAIRISTRNFGMVKGRKS